MDKDIRQYLPYYIGQFVYIESFGKFKLVGYDLLQDLYGIKSGTYTKWHPVSPDMKLELRKLDSMTKEEMTGLLLSMIPPEMQDAPDADDHDLDMFYNDGGNMVDGDETEFFTKES